MTDIPARGLRVLFNHPGKLVLWLLLACVLSFANTLHNDFALDDDAVITGNSLVTQGIQSIPEILHRPFLYGSMRDSNDLYRPMPLALFAAEHSAFGENPMGFHAVNVLLYAAGVLLLFFFLMALLPSRNGLAFIASLLFAVHPIHTEVVANIKSADELLCFLFGFAALWCWLRFARGGNMSLLIAASLLFLLSLLSKETSYCFVALVPLLFFYWEKPKRSRLVVVSISVIAIAVVAFVLRLWVLNANNANHPFHIGFAENSLAATQHYGTRLATAIFILGWYLKLLIWPWPLRADYSFNTIPLARFSEGTVLLAAAIFLFFIGYFLWQLGRKRKDVFALSILFFLGPLVLVSNVFFLVGATMAERFLFFPSVGFCLAIALLLSRMLKGQEDLLSQKKLWLVLAPVTLIFLGISIYRNSEWKDNYSLAKADQARTPQSFRLAYYLTSATLNKANEAQGDTARQRALWREASGYALQSIAIYPHYSLTLAQAGSAFLNLHRFDSSAYFSQRALMLHPRDSFVRNNLAGAYFQMGRYHESAEQCRINMEQFPDYARAYLNLGACYLRLGLPDSAKAPLSKVLALTPDDQTAAYFLSVANDMSRQMHGQKSQ